MTKQEVGTCPLAAEVGAERVTLTDIAARAGVSRSTVSLVLRESPLVAARTRARVESAIEALGYVYNRHAANLRSGSSRTAGFVVCEITNPFYALLTAGVDEALDASGFVAFLGNTAEQTDRQRRFLTRMHEQGVDGFILCPAEGTRPGFLKEANCASVPCVLALRRVPGFTGDYVGPDYRLGADLATEHLIALGHTRVAFVGGARRIAPLAERQAGYRNALRRHGLEPGPVVPCPADRDGGLRAVAAVAQGGDAPPTAIVCYNDLVAFGVMLGLADRGLRPGRDVAVVGCDDVAEAALHRPALTTIATDPRGVGREAARLLLRRIARPGDHAAEQIILPPRLVVRQSCGAAGTVTVGRRPPTEAPPGWDAGPAPA